MTQNDRVAFANTLRGVAALSVLIFHYAGVFWLQRPGIETIIASHPVTGDVPHFAIALRGTLEPINLGAFGVGLFFLISGFVIPFSFNTFGRLSFCISRFFRLWPTYAAGFACTVASLAVNSWYFERPFPFSTQHVLIHSVAGLRDFLSTPPIDRIVWTLEVEIKFYIIAALVAPWLKRFSPLVFIVPIFLIGAKLAAPQLGSMIPSKFWYSAHHLSFMFIGVALNYFYCGGLSRALTSVICAALIAGVCQMPGMTALWPAYVVAMTVFVAAAIFPAMTTETRTLNFLARISYPLYVSHGVAGYALMLHLLRQGLPPLVAMLITTAIALAVAWLIHIVVEQPTHDFGKKLAAWTEDFLANRRQTALGR